jgi:hypothetical protein
VREGHEHRSKGRVDRRARFFPKGQSKVCHFLFEEKRRRDRAVAQLCHLPGEIQEPLILAEMIPQDLGDLSGEGDAVRTSGLHELAEPKISLGANIQM